MNGHQKQKEQSGRMIEASLFELMEEKSFAQITVSEIVKRADVARRTFYRLYGGKEEVLRCYFGRLCRDYRRKYPALKGYDISRIAVDYFSFWHQHRDFLLLMHKSGLDDMLYYEISRASAEVVKNRIGDSEMQHSEEAGYFAYYSVGGFILLLHRWIAEGMQGTPEEYAQTVSEALLKFIRPVTEQERRG